jgi:hypothetical protein
VNKLQDKNLEEYLKSKQGRKDIEHLACLCGFYVLFATMEKHNCSLTEALEICVKNIKQKEAQ